MTSRRMPGYASYIIRVKPLLLFPVYLRKVMSWKLNHLLGQDQMVSKELSLALNWAVLGSRMGW